MVCSAPTIVRQALLDAERRRRASSPILSAIALALATLACGGSSSSHPSMFAVPVRIDPALGAEGALGVSADGRWPEGSPLVRADTTVGGGLEVRVFRRGGEGLVEVVGLGVDLEAEPVAARTEVYWYRFSDDARPGDWGRAQALEGAVALSRGEFPSREEPLVLEYDLTARVGSVAKHFREKVLVRRDDLRCLRIEDARSSGETSSGR